jgi:ribonuclease P protein component
MQRYTFGKHERLVNKRLIEQLFNASRAYKDFPFMLLAHPAGKAEETLQVLISVSKRHMRKAHDRNRVKRLMREVWRMQKHKVNEALRHHGLTAVVALVYLGKELPDLAHVETKISALNQRFIEDMVNLTTPLTGKKEHK